MCPCARPARRRSPGIGDEVALTLPLEAGGIAIDVGALRLALRLVGQNVGEQRPPTVLQLAADQRAQLGAVLAEGGAEVVAATEPDAQDELLATTEGNVRGPKDFPVLIHDRWQLGQDSDIGTVVSDLRDGSGKPEAELPELGVLVTVRTRARSRTPSAGLGDVPVAGRRGR